VQTCIWPSWCHYHSLSLAPVKSRLVLLFWYRLTQVVLEKRPLNGCSSSHHIWMLHKRPCFICFVTVSIAFWLAFLTEIWSYCVLALDSRIAMRWWMLWGRCLKWYIYVPPTCIVSVIIQTLNNVVLSMPLDRPFRTRLLLLVWPSCSFTF